MSIKGILFVFAALNFLCASTSAMSVEPIEFTAYAEKVKLLGETCRSKGMSNFSGFCLSKEYGSVLHNNPTQASINTGLEISSFEYFLSACEHSDIGVEDAMAKAKSVWGAETFFNETRTQTEALRNYVGRFYFCKSKAENDALILQKVAWFQHMAKEHSLDGDVNGPPVRLVSSRKPARSIVDCILSGYHGSGNDFAVDGLMAKDGGIVISLIAPTMQPIAEVRDAPTGSMTQYINTNGGKNKTIPSAGVFNLAVLACQ